MTRCFHATYVARHVVTVPGQQVPRIFRMATLLSHRWIRGEFSDVWGNLEEARGEFGKKKKREKNSVEWNEDNEPE